MLGDYGGSEDEAIDQELCSGSMGLMLAGRKLGVAFAGYTDGQPSSAPVLAWVYSWECMINGQEPAPVYIADLLSICHLFQYWSYFHVNGQSMASTARHECGYGKNVKIQSS